MQSNRFFVGFPEEVQRLGIQERIQMRGASEAVQTGAHAAEQGSDAEKGTRRFLIGVLIAILVMIAGLGIWCYTYTHFKMFGSRRIFLPKKSPSAEAKSPISKPSRAICAGSKI